MLTSEQIRAARAALRMEQTSLAEKAGVSVETIKRIESMDGKARAQNVTLYRIKQALELEGIVFTDEHEDQGPGFWISKDKNERIRKSMSSEVANLIDVALQVAVLKDREFFNRSIEHIVSEIMLGLPGLLKRTLPDAMGRKREE